MHILLTISVILIQGLLLVAGYYVAERQRLDALKLRTARERIGELEAGVESLRKQIASLRGKFYATRNYEGTPLATAGGDEPFAGRVAPGTAPACDNWAIAQDPAHPEWRVARTCDCRYCLEQRHVRGAEKSRILAEHAKRSKPVNGGE